MGTCGIAEWHRQQAEECTAPSRRGKSCVHAAESITLRSYYISISQVRLLQEDGTLGAILGDAAALEALLDALCGVTGPKERDSEARAALAEAVELLVSAGLDCDTVPCPVTWLHVQLQCRSRSTGERRPAVSWSPALGHGCMFGRGADAGPLGLYWRCQRQYTEVLSVQPVTVTPAFFLTLTNYAQGPGVHICVKCGLCRLCPGYSHPAAKGLPEMYLPTCRMQACLTILINAVPCRWQQTKVAKSCGTSRLRRC